MQDLIDQRTEERAGTFRVSEMVDNQFSINKHQYELVKNYKDCFDLNRFVDRFSTILTKYDYIVGDWGYDQLRLRGFYSEDNPLFIPNRGIQTIDDYLYEECNFGCAYFIVKNMDVNIPHHIHHRKNRNRNDRFFKERHFNVKHRRNNSHIKRHVSMIGHGSKQHFVIRKREHS